MGKDGDRIDIVVGTEDGVVGVADGVRRLGLKGHRVSALYAFREPGRADPVLLAGTYGEGLHRSADGGESWHATEGMAAPALCTIGPDPVVAGALLCGTEPGRLFLQLRRWHHLVRAGGHLRAARPRGLVPALLATCGGQIRNVDAVPGDAGHMVASVEVGGMLRTTDSGETWTVEEVAGNDDIHQLAGDPTQAGRLWASLGYAALPTRVRHPGDPHLGGVARSDDGGHTWALLHTDYTRIDDPGARGAGPGALSGRLPTSARPVASS